MCKYLLLVLLTFFIPMALAGGCSKNQDDPGTGPPDPGGSVLYGFTPFPYDLSQEAVDKVHEIILPNSNLYAIHYDRCIPWQEALDGVEFPEWIVRDWDDTKKRIPDTHAVYLAIAPTATDRINLAPNCGPGGEDDVKPFPPRFEGARFNDDAVKQAFLNYTLRTVRHYEPSYLNIGIEITGMSLETPERWRDFEELYDYVAPAIKAEFPDIRISVSFVLQTLLLDRVAKQVKPLLERSDYLGLSFYPYGSEFGEARGEPPLPGEIPAQWKEPLDFARNYTDKPIAITETGYTTKDIFLSELGINFPGDEEKQKAYVRDLVEISKENDFIFVVWFVPVDYERLLDHIPGFPEFFLIWKNAGLFDADVNPKPAWEEWMGFKD